LFLSQNKRIKGIYKCGNGADSRPAVVHASHSPSCSLPRELQFKSPAVSAVLGLELTWPAEVRSHEGQVLGVVKNGPTLGAVGVCSDGAGVVGAMGVRLGMRVDACTCNLCMHAVSTTSRLEKGAVFTKIASFGEQQKASLHQWFAP